MRSVCMIPSIDCLIYHDIEHWINIFEARSGRLPTDIVFPAFVESGSSYTSQFSAANLRQGNQNTLGQWINEVRNLVTDITVWASIAPTIPELVNDLIALRDQWDEPMIDACIVNPTVQTILGKIFAEVRDLGADGVVLDLTDVYPNSTSAKYPLRERGRPLQNTCFCRFCIDSLKREARWIEGGTPFRPLERGISRFVLKATAAGATPIDVRDSWLDKLNASELVEFSLARGFITSQDEDSGPDALKLLHYLTGRAKVTAGAVKKLCLSASNCGLRTSLVLCSCAYDMSTNSNLTTLMNNECADEYWVSNFEPSHLDREGIVLLRFLAGRGTYYFNSMFLHLDRISKLSDIDLLDDGITTLANHASSLSGRNEFNIGQCAQIPFFAGISGFVGIPFDKSEFIDLITKKTIDGTLMEKYKNSIILKIDSGVTKITFDQSESSNRNNLFD